MQKKDNSNVHPLVKFMNKKITVQMLEAHFNALPELLRYIIKQGETDLGARMALHNFQIQAAKERQCLDPAEAVYGFSANLIQIGSAEPGEDLQREKEFLSEFVSEFCKANELGAPGKDWITKLKMVRPEVK